MSLRNGLFLLLTVVTTLALSQNKLEQAKATQTKPKSMGAHHIAAVQLPTDREALDLVLKKTGKHAKSVDRKIHLSANNPNADAEGIYLDVIGLTYVNAGKAPSWGFSHQGSIVIQTEPSSKPRLLLMVVTGSHYGSNQSIEVINGDSRVTRETLRLGSPQFRFVDVLQVPAPNKSNQEQGCWLAITMTSGTIDVEDISLMVIN